MHSKVSFPNAMSEKSGVQKTEDARIYEFENLRLVQFNVCKTIDVIEACCLAWNRLFTMNLRGGEDNVANICGSPTRRTAHVRSPVETLSAVPCCQIVR